MSRQKNEQLNVEQALSKLEATVNDIQDEELGLGQALTAFEQGVILVRETQKALYEAEQKVAELTGEPAAQSRGDSK